MKWSALLVVVFAISIPQSVLAQRAVVLDFDGASADHARDTVVRAVGADLTLVARSDIYRIARVAGVEVREAARREGVAIIIRGHVGATVDLVAQHVDGHVMGQISGPVPHSRTEVRRLARSARTLVANVLGGDGDGNGDGDGEAETPRKAATERARSRRPGRERAPNADAEGASHDSDGSGDGSGAELDPSLPPLVDVGVGLGLRSRDADVALANGARRRFRSGMFPEIVGVALLRPFRASGRLAAGVFAAAHLAYGVGLTTLDENENVLDTQVFRLRADAGYLLPYEIAEIGIVVGLGYDAFSLPEDSQLFPSANYGYTRIGLSGRIALAGSLLRLDIDLGARIVLDAGPLTPFFGQTSSVFGFDVRAGVGGETSFGLSYGIHLGYQRWSMLFTGMSAVADNAGVEGADASFLAHATLGFVVPE